MTSRKKTSDGNGSIRKEMDAEGRVVRWRYEVMVGYKPDGKRDVRRGSAKTEREARKSLNALASAKDARRLPSASAGRDTVADHLRRWLQGCRHEMEVRSWRREEQNVNIHLIPALGRLKLGHLSPAHVREFLGAKATGGLAPATVKYIRGTLARALDQAMIDGQLPINVARVERRRRSKSV